MIEQDRAVMWRVVDNAIAAGRLPHDVSDLVEIQIMPPSLHVRDQLQQAQVDRIAFDSGVLSPQTWSQHLGLDYDQEQKNLAVHVDGNDRIEPRRHGGHRGELQMERVDSQIAAL